MNDVEYLNYLCNLVNVRPGLFDILIEELFNLDFYWTDEVPLDFNRGEDGLILRSGFYGDDGSDGTESLGGKDCSVLEALIGLAEKMNYLLDDDDRGDRTRIWFWEFIHNLGLDDFTDEVLENDLATFNEIDAIVMNWLNRDFDASGLGSPWPLEKPFRDQRKLQMMDQLNDYVLERYVINDEIL